MLIEIAISTLNDGIKDIRLNPDFNYIIIHQVTNDKDYTDFVDELKTEKVNYFLSDAKGLSKSRNMALSHSESKFLWVMDDDVIIDKQAFTRLENILNSELNFDLLIVSHATSCENNINNTYERIRKVNKYSAMSVSSIDMIINRHSVLQKKIKFNEKFGLGTSYPSGEEYLFTVDCLNYGLKVIKTNEIFSYHPPISSGMDFFSTTDKLKAKFFMFNTAFGPSFGRLLYFSFIIKKSVTLMKNKKLIQAIKVAFVKMDKE